MSLSFSELPDHFFNPGLVFQRNIQVPDKTKALAVLNKMIKENRWYTVAIAVGALVTLGALCFGTLATLGTVGTFGNMTHIWSLWLISGSGLILGGTLITFGALKMGKNSQKAKAEQKEINLANLQATEWTTVTEKFIATHFRPADQLEIQQYAQDLGVNQCKVIPIGDVHHYIIMNTESGMQISKEILDSRLSQNLKLYLINRKQFTEQI